MLFYLFESTLRNIGISHLNEAYASAILFGVYLIRMSLKCRVNQQPCKRNRPRVRNFVLYRLSCPLCSSPLSLYSQVFCPLVIFPADFFLLNFSTTVISPLVFSLPNYFVALNNFVACMDSILFSV